MGLAVYSTLLALALALGSPWWIWRMARSGRYRAGLGQRLGRVPPALAAAVQGKRIVWLHAVSVGEVLAAERLVHELGGALGPGWLVCVSTTTATGQAVARERFGAGRVFFLPLDFALPVRRFLRALRPELLVTIESELWPRLIVECARAGIPVAVANARVSDRSLPRYLRLRRLWRPLLNRVSLFLAQGEESAERLRRMGVDPARVRSAGNLKFDPLPPKPNRIAEEIAGLAAGRPIVVAGSTLAQKIGNGLNEEEILIKAWEGELRRSGVLLVLAPRHPERFETVIATTGEFRMRQASSLPQPADESPEIVVLDTIGDLAAVYGLSHVAFIGGSLVGCGGHNPLEAARFGVPIVMGPSYENFREVVEGMRAADAIRIVQPGELEGALLDLLQHGKPMGRRAHAVFEAQSGATARTVAALISLVGSNRA